MSDSWPMPGYETAYKVDEELTTGSLGYYLSVPSTMTEIDLATVRVSRHGGPSPADDEFRERLFKLVGSITVAGAHVEAGMKRLLVLLTGQRTVFEVVDHEWAELHKRLRAQCDGSDGRRKRLARALDWAEERRLRELRHTAVHGAWWTYDGCGARAGRWPRKATGHTSVSSFESWETVAKDLWTYVERLDELLAEDWPRAVLPKQQVPPAFGGG